MASSSSSSSEQQQTQAQQQQQPSTVLAYPLPPLQYINNIDPDNLPTPPAPITDGIYHMFGQKISLDDAIIAPLEAHGTKRLFPRTEYDHKKELKKINASILVNFLDLIDVLVKCPDTDKRVEKCNDLATLFINFHHLINELRPHQARETLRVWLTAQKRTREEITKKLNAEMDKMTRVLDRYYEYEQQQRQQQQLQQHQQQEAGGSAGSSRLSEANGQSTLIAGAQMNQQQTATIKMEDQQQTNLALAAPSSLDDIMCEIIDETSLK